MRFKFTVLYVLLLLLFRHSAKSLNAQEVRLATSPLFEPWLHLPHVKVVRLHVRQSNVNILVTETAAVWAIVLLFW